MIKSQRSRIVDAIFEAQSLIDGEIHVHLSQRFLEFDTLGRAKTIFKRMGLNRVTSHPVIFFYLNLRYRKFALIGNQKADQMLRPDGWARIGAELKSQLLSTHFERGIALTVRVLGRAYQNVLGKKTNSLTPP